jgi:hypothetical protein
MPTTQTDTVPLFGRAVPAAAFRLLLQLEDEGFDVRVDPETRELCLAPRVPAQLRQDIARYKHDLIFLVEQVLALLEAQDDATI